MYLEMLNDSRDAVLNLAVEYLKTKLTSEDMINSEVKELKYLGEYDGYRLTIATIEKSGKTKIRKFDFNDFSFVKVSKESKPADSYNNVWVKMIDRELMLLENRGEIRQSEVENYRDMAEYVLIRAKQKVEVEAQKVANEAKTKIAEIYEKNEGLYI